MNAPEIGLGEDHPSCRMTDNLEYNQALENWIDYVFNGLPKDINRQIEEKQDEWIRGEMQSILFEGEYSTQQNPRSGVIIEETYQVEPKCFIHPEESQITITVPLWTLTAYSDPAGRIRLDLVETKEDWHFEFDVEELGQRGETQVYVHRPSTKSGVDKMHYVLKYCPEGSLK